MSPLTLLICALAAIAPTPEDRGAGLLFHASFDVDRKADFAIGDRVASQGWGSVDRDAAVRGRFIPGPFGQAMTGRESRVGYYDARANFNPRRGTVAFFLKLRNKPYKFEPFLARTVDYYYWHRYLRLEYRPGGHFATSFANEVYRPQVLYGPAGAFKEDTWHHIAVVWDETQGYVTYVDGEIHASNWGKHSWLSHGVDINYFSLQPDDDVAYDELYVFDRPLSQTQVAALMRDNAPPASFEPVTFDDTLRRHRLAEMSWLQPDPAMPVANIGGSDVVRQVVPRRARAVKGECNIAIDGKLGNGFPGIYGYSYAGGNGLHVDLPEQADYVTIEGHFAGRVYAGDALLERGRTPIADIRSKQFMHRWRMDQPQDGWIGFFRSALEDLTSAPDKEQLITGRINELGFFRLAGVVAPTGPAQRWYLGTAQITSDMIGFTAGDRAAFTLHEQLPLSPGGQAVPALRYHHVLLPAAPDQRVLAAVRLRLWLTGDLADNAVRFELHDPLLPTRRLMAFDHGIASKQNPAGPVGIDLTFDVADHVVPANTPVWITLCFKQDVEVCWRDAQHASFVEWIGGDRDRAIAEHFAADMPTVLSRFAELAESRPWGAVAVPEIDLRQSTKIADELFTPLAFMRELQPDHPTVRGLWGWTHKDTMDTSPVEVTGEGPRWALLQRELVRRCHDVYAWWIENRQVPSGEFGDDLNDDTDFMQDAGRYAMWFDPDGRLGNAALAVAEACERTGRITAGVPTGPMDPLHGYEEGTNMLPVAAMVRYGDPVWVGKLMEAHRTIEERFTALDVHGRRRFRSDVFGYNEVRDQGNHGVDTFLHGLMAHPAMFLSYFSRNPRALKFVTDYADGWIAYWADAQAAGEKRIPAATKLDGTVVRWDYKLRGWGFDSLFVGAMLLTGEQRYREVAWNWFNPEGNVFRTAEALAAADITKHARSVAAWADQADLTRMTVDQFGYVARQRYVKFEALGDEQAAIDALEASLRNIRMLFDAYTLGEPQNDRIWPPDTVASVMALGESPDARNQMIPRHYVSYEGFTDLAAWVRRKSDTALTVWLYSFAPGSEQGMMRVWRTPAGSYAVAFAGDTKQMPLHRGAGIPITLEPGKVHELTLELVQRDEADFWQRPDAAVSPSQVKWMSDNTLAVTVHNLGNHPLTDMTVALIDEGGNVVASQTVPHIDAPLDLHPRMVEVTFANVPPSARQVSLDPAKRIAELYDLNNRADLPQGVKR